MSLDLHKIIKRLELIKNLIILEDEDDIDEQVSKLRLLQIPTKVQVILTNLSQKLYGNAVKEIEEFIAANNQVLKYIDPEIEALRLEAKALESQIQDESYEKAGLEKLIHEFSVRYNQELGELIIEILEIRKSKAANTSQQKQAEEDYNSFYSNYEVTKNEELIELTIEEQRELKDKYRKASKLCHPDVVAEEFKSTAHKIFTELNEAYEKNNLNRVSQILDSLLGKNVFNSYADVENEKANLVKELSRLRQKLEEIRNSILEIKESETFETLSSIHDWDIYFSEKKVQLKQQLDLLNNGAK